MRFDQAVILTDLDGTFLNSRGEVSEADLAAIRVFLAEGGLFGIATGREPHNARRFLADVPLNAPSILLNGAAVYDFVAQRYLNTILMDTQAALQVLLHCRRLALPLDMQVYTTEGIFYATPLETADPGFLRIHQPTSFLSLEELSTRDWLKAVLLEREAGALAPMRSFLKQSGLDRQIHIVEGTTDVVKAGKYQELLPHDVTKGTAVPVLRTLPAYAGRRIVAVGDYWNDWELLTAVDLPCAPDNAIDEIKAVCRHILPSNNQSPIAHLIREILPAV